MFSHVCRWDPPESADSPRNVFLENSEWVFQILFTIEAMIKIVAMGFMFGKLSYLRDGWNVVDLVIIVLGWLGKMNTGDSAFTAFRAVRVLRPLRTVRSIPGMHVLVESLLASLPMLFHVMLLCSFLFFVFGIVGVTLFRGRLRQRCVLGDGITVHPEDAALSRYCSLEPENFGRSCPGNTTCVATDNNPNVGLTSFDNLATAFLTIFTCITLEGWTDVMYGIQDTSSGYTALYFIFLVVLGSFFVLNLVVAVLCVNYTYQRKPSLLRPCPHTQLAFAWESSP